MPIEVDTGQWRALVAEMATLKGEVTGALTGFGNRMDGVAEFVRKLQANVDALNTGVGERDTTLLRVQQLETQMDDLPRRVGDLEDYGSKHVLKLEPLVQKLEQQVKALKKKPKKKQRKERERWARQQQRMNLYIAVASVLAVVLSIYVNYLLFHH